MAKGLGHLANVQILPPLPGNQAGPNGAGFFRGSVPKWQPLCLGLGCKANIVLNTR